MGGLISDKRERTSLVKLAWGFRNGGRSQCHLVGRGSGNPGGETGGGQQVQEAHAGEQESSYNRAQKS